MPNTSGWDREYAEESRASEWSNDPEGFRVEQIEESQDETPASADDSYDEPPLDVEADLSTDNEPSASYQEPQAETLPEQLDSDTRSDDDTDDDDSIEAYMNRLLNRGQSHASSEASEPETVSLSIPKSSSGWASRSEREINSEYDQADQEPIDPDAPLVPRSHAPEKNGNLSAMRELANASARSAISRSVRVQNRDTQIKGAISFACAGGAVVCGVACLIYLPGIVRYMAVAMTAVVAVIYVLQGRQEFSEATLRWKAAQARLASPEQEVANESELEAESEIAENIGRDE